MLAWNEWITIIGAGVSLTCFIGGIALFFYKRWRTKLDTALDTLTRSFSGVIAHCESPSDESIKAVMAKHLDTQTAAVNSILRLLPSKRQRPFSKLWNTYRESALWSMNDLFEEPGFGNGGYWYEISEREQRKYTRSQILRMIDCVC